MPPFGGRKGRACGHQALLLRDVKADGARRSTLAPAVQDRTLTLIGMPGE